MGTTDKKVAAAIRLLRKRGQYKISRSKKPISNIYFELSYLFGLYSRFVKKPITKRKICMKVVKSKALDVVLDKYVKGQKKRAAFDDRSPKMWTEKTLTKDITSKGQFKRYKLVERHINRFWNSETTRIIFDDDYSVQDFIDKNKSSRK
jgi:hypothetical protein